MRRLLPYLILGPVSGPLFAGVVRHHRTAPVLAGLYAIALVTLAFDLPCLLVALQAFVRAHG